MDPVMKHEDHGSLSQYYNDLKDGMRRPAPEPVTVKVSGGMMPDRVHPGALAFRHAAAQQAKCLAKDCHKHMLLDIYCKILPLDQDYIDGHRGQMSADIDHMLAGKGMDATQYLTSCYEATKAPLVEFMLRVGNQIGDQFMEDANATLADAPAKGIDAPKPEAPSIEDKEIQSQLVDVSQDKEYESFIDKLKQKTIDKVVSDVSKIIAGKKEEQAMTFTTNPTPAAAGDDAQVESTTSVGADYITKRMIKEHIEQLPDDGVDQILGMAIREATLNQIDVCFKQPGSTFREYSNRVFLGKGYVISEASVTTFLEEMSDRYKKLMTQVADKKAEDSKKLADHIEQWKQDGEDEVDALKKSIGASQQKSNDTILRSTFGDKVVDQAGGKK